MYEKKKEKMTIFKYTKEEIENLKNSLRYIKFLTKNIGRQFKQVSYCDITKEDIESDQCYAIITIDKKDERVRTNQLFDLLDKNIVGYCQSTIYTIISFLFYTELKKVPLYINKIPEFANWRLRIGK